MFTPNSSAATTRQTVEMQSNSADFELPLVPVADITGDTAPV